MDSSECKISVMDRGKVRPRIVPEKNPKYCTYTQVIYHNQGKNSFFYVHVGTCIGQPPAILGDFHHWIGS